MASKDDAGASILSQLMGAALEAEHAEADLDAARRAFEIEPTAANLERLRIESRLALQKEAQFDLLWRRASTEWFGSPFRSVAKKPRS